MSMLKWINDPMFRGVMLRRTTPQFSGPGGLLETGQEMYRHFGAELKIRDNKFVFPSGANIVCKGCEHEKDKHNFQGWQVSAFLVDEAQQFEESQVVYFISRMRTEAKMKPQMLMTANPDYSSFLRKWLTDAGYLDVEGLPKEDRSGKEMWFIRIGNDMVWKESKEELHKIYGKDCGPMSFTFIPATCRDNPILLERDPTYLFKLQNLPRVERMRLLEGCWYAREESSGYFKREWVQEVPEPYDRSDILKTIRAWDIAGSLPSEALPDPDYTVGVKMSRLRQGGYIIEDVVRFRARHGEVQRKIVEVAKNDGSYVDIVVPRDPGSAGQAASAMLVQEITSYGFYVRARPTNKSKVDRFKPFAAAAEHNLIQVVRNCADDLENEVFRNNDIIYNELERFDGGRKGHDDVVDAVGDAFMALAQIQHIPQFDLPDFTSDNPYKIYTHQ